MTRLTPEQARAEFSVLQTETFLDWSYKAPYPARSVRAMLEFMERRHTSILPDGRGDGRPDSFERIRSKIARLLGVSSDEVWFPQSTNDGLYKVARMLLRPGDEILVGGLDHPSNYMNWMHLTNHGVNVRVVPHRDGRMVLADIEAAVGPKTRAVGLCLVNTYNGYRQDIKELGDLARRRDLFLLLDAIQGIGHLNIDLSSGDVTAMSGGVFKWLCSPEGTAVGYLNRDVANGHVPDQVYYMNAEFVFDDESTDVIDRMFRYGYESTGPQPLHGGDFKLAEGARRMEQSPTLLSLTGLEAVVDMFVEFGGMSVIERRVMSLTTHLRSELKEHGHLVLSSPEPEHMSGIASVAVSDAQAFTAFLQERRIWVLAQKAATQGREAVRVSTHFFNNIDDIALFIEAADDFRGLQSRSEIRKEIF